MITAHLDYEPLPGNVVVLQPEEAEHNIHIKVVADDVLESDKQFLLELMAPEDQRVCPNQSGVISTITIKNDDGKSYTSSLHTCR